MSKHNLINKTFKKKILSINNFIESNFNKLKYFKTNYKKIIINKENKVFLVLISVVILTLIYFIIPTLYDKNTIKSQIKNQISKNYDVKITSKNQVQYSIFPKPHFLIKDVKIFRQDNVIGNTKNLQVFINPSRFFSINKIDIKDLNFDKTEFSIYLDDIAFFQNLLKVEPNDNEISFKKSNIFFKNKQDEVLFIVKIKNSKFFYDSKNLQNILISKNEVFKVPFKLIIKNDKFNKEIFSKVNFKKIRLNIENKISYANKIKSGLLEILFINRDTSIQYKIIDNSLEFLSNNNKNRYQGKLDFKPFYLNANFNYEGISTKNLFDENSLFIDLINSEILNNKNLNVNFSLNVKDITNIDELNNLDLKVLIEEGEIIFSESKIMWKESLDVNLNDGTLLVNETGINLIGSILLKFKDIDNFYRSFQIPKKNRKDINEIRLDFIYNFNSKNISFDNPKINGIQNQNLEKFLFKSSKDNSSLNKIKFKNFVNNFFRAYAG